MQSTPEGRTAKALREVEAGRGARLDLDLMVKLNREGLAIALNLTDEGRHFLAPFGATNLDDEVFEIEELAIDDRVRCCSGFCDTRPTKRKVIGDVNGWDKPLTAYVCEECYAKSLREAERPST